MSDDTKVTLILTVLLAGLWIAGFMAAHVEKAL